MCDSCLSPKIHSLLASPLPCALKCWPLLCQVASNWIQQKEDTRKRLVGQRRERLGVLPCSFLLRTCYGSTHPSTTTAPAGGPFSRASTLKDSRNTFLPFPLLGLRIVTASYYYWSSMHQLLSHLCRKPLY